MSRPGTHCIYSMLVCSKACFILPSAKHCAIHCRVGSKVAWVVLQAWAVVVAWVAVAWVVVAWVVVGVAWVALLEWVEAGAVVWVVRVDAKTTSRFQFRLQLL